MDKITAHEDYLGKVINDIINMRGEFDSPIINNGKFTIEATLPVATSFNYPVDLGILTGGRGVITTKFTGYKECPFELGAITKRRGINPLDRSKWILGARHALD